MAQLFVTRRPYSVVKDRCSLRRILPPPRTANLLYRGVAAFSADQLRIAPGGDSRDRTGNLRLAKPALSQLSYIPGSLVGLSGLEPLTSRLSGARSNHLSYRPPRLDSLPGASLDSLRSEPRGAGHESGPQIGRRVRARFLKSEIAHACVETPGDDLETGSAVFVANLKRSAASRSSIGTEI